MAGQSSHRTRGQSILEKVCDVVIDYECAHFSLNHFLNFWPLFCMKMDKKLSASGSFAPLNLHQGLCPWTQLRALSRVPVIGSHSSWSPTGQKLDPPLDETDNKQLNKWYRAVENTVTRPMICIIYSYAVREALNKLTCQQCKQPQFGGKAKHSPGWQIGSTASYWSLCQPAMVSGQECFHRVPN